MVFVPDVKFLLVAFIETVASAQAYTKVAEFGIFRVLYQKMSGKLRVPCEVAECGWTSPLLPSSLYPSMVEQLRLHQASVHSLQPPLTLPTSAAQWSTFVTRWRQHGARLAAASEQGRVEALLAVCGGEVATRLSGVCGPGLVARGEEEVLGLVHLVLEWGPAVARLLLQTEVKREEGEEVVDFTARVQRVVEECDFQEQCRTCGGQVDFGGQMLRDAVTSSLQERGKAIDAATVVRVEKVCAEASSTPVSRATGLHGHKEGVKSFPKKVLVKNFDVAAAKEKAVKIVGDAVDLDSNQSEDALSKDVDHNYSDVEVKQEKEEIEEEEMEEKVLTCNDCKSSRVFKTKKGLIKHKKVFCKKTKILAIGNKSVKCTICERTFKYRVGLKKHLEKEHQSGDTGDAGPSKEKVDEDMDLEIKENNNDKDKKADSKVTKRSFVHINLVSGGKKLRFKVLKESLLLEKVSLAQSDAFNQTSRKARARAQCMHAILNKERFKCQKSIF